MSSFLASIDSQIVLLIAAIAVVALFVRVIWRLFSIESGSILAIVGIVLILNYVFHITPKQLWFEMSHLPQDISRLVQSLG